MRVKCEFKLKTIVGSLKTLPGVVRVDLSWPSAPTGMGTVGAMRGRMGTAMGGDRFMRFHRGTLTRIAPPTIDERSGAQTVNIAMILMNTDHAPVGGLEIVIKFDSLTAAIAAAPWWRSANACIVDRASGRILFASSRMQGRKLLGGPGNPLENRLLEKIKRNSSGTIRGHGHSLRQVAGFDSFDTLPWALVIITDGKTILAPIIRFRNGKREEVAVLMADSRGFTPLAERLSPEATIEVRNRFFSARCWR